MNKEYQYINDVAGNTVVPIPSVTYSDILYLMREGVGIRLENVFSSGDVPATVWRFRAKYKKINPESPAKFFLVSSSGSTRKYEILGDALTVGIIYIISVIGIAARHEVQSGDTLSDILNDLADQINNADYDLLSASATVDGNYIIITTPAIIKKIYLDVAYNTDLLYISADYAIFKAIGEYFSFIINLDQDNKEYPEHGSIEDTYDYDAVTRFTGQLVDYFRPSGYNNDFPIEYLYSETVISDFPYLPSTTSRAVLDEPNNRIIFSPQSQLRKHERVNLLYK